LVCTTGTVEKEKGCFRVSQEGGSSSKEEVRSLHNSKVRRGESPERCLFSLRGAEDLVSRESLGGKVFLDLGRKKKDRFSLRSAELSVKKRGGGGFPLSQSCRRGGGGRNDVVCRE